MTQKAHRRSRGLFAWHVFSFIYSSFHFPSHPASPPPLPVAYKEKLSSSVEINVTLSMLHMAQETFPAWSLVPQSTALPPAHPGSLSQHPSSLCQGLMNFQSTTTAHQHPKAVPTAGQQRMPTGHQP